MPDTQPDSGRRLHPLETVSVPDGVPTHSGKVYTVSHVYSVWNSLFCLLSVQQEKETMLNVKTRLPSCMLKTNKPDVI